MLFLSCNIIKTSTVKLKLSYCLYSWYFFSNSLFLKFNMLISLWKSSNFIILLIYAVSILSSCLSKSLICLLSNFDLINGV